MNQLFVYADFDFLPKEEYLGVLEFDSVRGKNVYTFTFANSWLSNHSDIFLDPGLYFTSGRQYSSDGKIFGMFSDCLPDRWGRMLFKRREDIKASSSVHKSVLTDFELLSGIDDYSRMGGFRFKNHIDGDFINVDKDELSIPPISDIRKLMDACKNEEQMQEKGFLASDLWLKQLLKPGTSLGGARPKAVVTDNDILYVAKFPSRNDMYDVGLFEHFSNLLSKECGIHTADSNVLNIGENHHVFLSKRFDRNSSLRRIHFASAMTLCNFSDGDGFSEGKGYLDIVDVITNHCINVDDNLAELYRRIAFNICIGNTDDHFRNHGFLLTNLGWTLSPSYDINPSLLNYHSLTIGQDSNVSDLNLLYNLHDEYYLTGDTALSIINDVIEGLNKWDELAKKLNLPLRENLLFKNRMVQVIDKYKNGSFKKLDVKEKKSGFKRSSQNMNSSKSRLKLK